MSIRYLEQAMVKLSSIVEADALVDVRDIQNEIRAVTETIVTLKWEECSSNLLRV